MSEREAADWPFPAPDAWVIGAGWAGLAAACRLVESGLSVGLLEATAAAGGRARQVRHQGRCLDYGQHLMLGAYGAVRQLLEQVGAGDGLRASALQMTLYGGDGTLSLSIPRSAGPAGRLSALFKAFALQHRSRPVLLGALWRLLRRPPAGQSVTGWLQATRQPDWLRRQLWQPLCLAALNTPPQRASARVYWRVLRESFGGARGATDWLLPVSSLGASVSEPVLNWLHASGRCRLLTRAPVRALAPADGRIGPRLDRDRSLPPAPTILALPPAAAATLLAALPATVELADRLGHWHGNPITTLYLGLARRPALPAPVIGLTDGPVEWLIDRAHCGQPDILAAVVSADTDRRAPALRYPEVLAQLRRHLPDLDRPRWHLWLQVADAAFDCDTTSEERRPGPGSGQDGLWLAGDYTDTGLPGTLEGAVRSGFTAATALIGQRRSA